MILQNKVLHSTHLLFIIYFSMTGSQCKQRTEPSLIIHDCVFLTRLGASLAGMAFSVPPADGLSPRIHVRCY